MGDIAINHLKDLNLAEKSFRAVLKTTPHHLQALHNLCVVHAERGRLKEAEGCLVDVLNKQPQEEYVKKHLEIVRKSIKRTGG